ncbi:S1/P1 nuclease [Flavobacterium psychrophilum]
MRKSIFITTILIISILIPSKSFAWGKKGHNLVAEVAFNYLDENTKKIVLQYLDGMTIQEASTWMDDIKNDHGFDYMKPLHYINSDKGQNISSNNGNNIIGTLTKTIEELKNYKTLSKEDVKTRICIIFHLIGDLHQPLHVGYGEDKGGNTYQISFFGRGTNLHSFYDSGIIEYKGLTLQQCLKAKSYSKLEVSEIGKINVVEWANQSRSNLGIIYNTNGHKVDEIYIDKNYIIIQDQIVKAGIRLSSLLKDIFK